MQFIFFLIFVIAVLTFGSITVGPYSLRVYMTVLMLVYLLVFGRSANNRSNRIRKDYIHIYLVCIATLGFALFVNGGLEVYGFVERCLAYYLVCIVAYFAVDVCVKKEKHIDTIIFIIALILLFDSIVTILQYQNNPLGWAIGAVFGDMEEFAYYLDDHVSYEGVSKLPGIWRPVTNGFFLGVATPMLLTGFAKGKSKILAIFYTAIMLTSLVAMFFLQQRAAFFLVLIVMAYHVLRSFVKHPSRFIIPTIAILLLGLLLMPSDVGDIEVGRLSSADNSSRTSLMGWAFKVILENPLFGDIVQYNKVAEYSAHNVLIDSLIDSGIFGFIPMCYLYFKTVLDSVHIMFKSSNNNARVFSYCVLICMGMGMFHNTSYMTGDVIIFLSLALMFKSEVFAKNSYRQMQ